MKGMDINISPTAQSQEYCDKHKCYKTVILKTDKVMCLKCGYEERRAFEESRAQKSYERWIEEKRLYFLQDFSLMDNELKQASFDNFVADTDAKRADIGYVKKQTYGYTQGLEHNLILIGDVGVGKSHLAYSAIKMISHLTDKIGAFINVVDLVRVIKKDFTLEADYLNKLAEVDYLVLDDVGTERVSEWSSNLLYTILNSRQNTIITTNLDVDGLEALYGKRLCSRMLKGTKKHNAVYHFRNTEDERL